MNSIRKTICIALQILCLTIIVIVISNKDINDYKMDSSDINTIKCCLTGLYSNNNNTYFMIHMTDNKEKWHIKNLNMKKGKDKIKLKRIKKIETDLYGVYLYIYKTNKKVDLDKCKLDAKLYRDKEVTNVSIKVKDSDIIIGGSVKRTELKVGKIYELNNKKIVNMGINDYKSTIVETEDGKEYKIVYEILYNISRNLSVEVLNDDKDISKIFKSIKIQDNKPIIRITLKIKIDDKTIEKWKNIKKTNLDKNNIEDILLNNIKLKVNYEDIVFYI